MQPLSGVRSRLALGLARLFLDTPLKRFGFRTASIDRWASKANYQADRNGQVPHYRDLFVRHTRLAGKTVVDLGCDEGGILDGLRCLEGFRGVGVDINSEKLARARGRWPALGFVQSTTTSIPLDSGSADVVYTIDTVEHLCRPRAIFEEVYRILRPGGTFLVHFHPWLSPYGSHLEDIVPYPWPHLLFSMDHLLEVAAHLFDSPDYQKPWFLLDKPNPYRDRRWWAEFLNKMTIAGYRRLVARLPFERVAFERIGFGGKTFKPARLLAWAAKVRPLDEVFSHAVFSVLRKPTAG